MGASLLFGHGIVGIKRNGKESYQMRLTLQGFYEQANPLAAKVFLDAWSASFLAFSIVPMVEIAQTIQAKAEGVLRWFRWRG